MPDSATADESSSFSSSYSVFLRGRARGRRRKHFL